MSGGISIGFVDFAAVSFDLDRVCWGSFGSFLVRNWCGIQEIAYQLRREPRWIARTQFNADP
jgi:hypothetical protein